MSRVTQAALSSRYTIENSSLHETWPRERERERERETRRHIDFKTSLFSESLHCYTALSYGFFVCFISPILRWRYLTLCFWYLMFFYSAWKTENVAMNDEQINAVECIHDVHKSVQNTMANICLSNAWKKKTLILLDYLLRGSEIQSNIIKKKKCKENPEKDFLSLQRRRLPFKSDWKITISLRWRGATAETTYHNEKPRISGAHPFSLIPHNWVNKWLEATGRDPQA